MDLTLDELIESPTVALIKCGRLALIRGEAPPELAAALMPEGEEEPAPAVEEAPAPDPQPEGEDEPSADAEGESTDPEGPSEDASADDPDGGDAVELEETDASLPVFTTPPELDDVSYRWSEDELVALTTSEQKTILRSRDLKVSGREADRVSRILDAQETS
jgi:hypothetical protein